MLDEIQIRAEHFKILHFFYYAGIYKLLCSNLGFLLQKICQLKKSFAGILNFIKHKLLTSEEWKLLIIMIDMVNTVHVFVGVTNFEILTFYTNLSIKKIRFPDCKFFLPSNQVIR